MRFVGRQMALDRVRGTHKTDPAQEKTRRAKQPDPRRSCSPTSCRRPVISIRFPDPIRCRRMS
jgi:hypothetical protein